ncbi:MAG: hypothetical protein IKU42_05040 [Oscillospiraceae bacterium]|nr:hypothetical protein [Oscillospiraceae bacterium]
MLATYLHRTIPSYYKTMYMDGFEPWEILEAKRKEMKSKFFDEEPQNYEIHFTSEIKVK